jgi:hypothetical protein
MSELPKVACEKCAYCVTDGDDLICRRFPDSLHKEPGQWCGEHSDFKRQLQAHDAGDTERRLMAAVMGATDANVRMPKQGG